MQKKSSLLKRIFVLNLFLALFGALTVFLYSELMLPEVQPLKTITLQSPLKILSADGKLIAEYGSKRRSIINMDDIPKQMIQAFIATEDQRFYEHNGVDFIGLFRAAIHLVRTKTKKQGGGTITMQVARNYFLTRERTFTRKFNEILLAWKIERVLTKEQILILYVNKIFFGNRAYGIGAAANTYYGTSIENLTLPQMAMLAGLPKAPSALNPLVNPERALQRRNHVLSRMLHMGYLDEEDYTEAYLTPITAKYHGTPAEIKAPYVAEMVRKQIVNEYGEHQAYSAGYIVHTTIDSKAQNYANTTLNSAIEGYDHRHGFRGPIDHFSTEMLLNDSGNSVTKRLTNIEKKHRADNFYAALVLKLLEKEAIVLLSDGREYLIPWQYMSWAKRYLSDYRTGSSPKSASDVLEAGDVIWVNKTDTARSKLVKLAQLPEVNGALVATAAETGAIIALKGGFDYSLNKFNRVTQAKRQPGSIFKPFIYSAALEKGFTAASIINDSPVVFDNTYALQSWRPENYSGKFYGPTRLRVALMKSRNLVSIRLLRKIGIDYTLDYVKRFGFDSKDMPRDLSLALGTGQITPLKLAEAYSTFANGGFKVTPYLIQKVTSNKGRVLYEATPETVCEQCDKEVTNIARRVITEENAYIMRSMLQDVIKRGTGRRAKKLDRNDIAGKTGTTNDQTDAWFAGFGSGIVGIAWIGFDKPKNLGAQETGGRSAVPIWTQFMTQYLADIPEKIVRQPSGIAMVKIDPITGQLAAKGQDNGVYEIFRKDFIPEKTVTTFNNSNQPIIQSNEADSLTHQLF